MSITLQNDALTFEFPDVHPEAKFSLEFQRTLRIPDDGKTYPLPPGLGRFPVRQVDDYGEQVPPEWRERGGVMLPMYQSEALWILFVGRHAPDRGSAYPFAVKIAAGKRCAVSGRAWTALPRSGRGEDQDYVVIPNQPWLDGFVVKRGQIRQFVAVPLGMGLTVEAQLDGKEEFGGIQIQAYPVKAAVFERRFPKRPIPLETLTRLAAPMPAPPCAAPASAMGLGAGGTMKQEVYEDPYGLDDWDLDHTGRVFVHLANSLTWRSITGSAPPQPPPTAKEYSRHGLPWFDYYAEEAKAVGATGLLDKIKSVLSLGKEKGLGGVLPENESVEVKSDQIKTIEAPKPGEVRSGKW